MSSVRRVLRHQWVAVDGEWPAGVPLTEGARGRNTFTLKIHLVGSSHVGVWWVDLISDDVPQSVGRSE